MRLFGGALRITLSVLQAALLMAPNAVLAAPAKTASTRKPAVKSTAGALPVLRSQSPMFDTVPVTSPPRANAAPSPAESSIAVPQAAPERGRRDFVQTLQQPMLEANDSTQDADGGSGPSYQNTAADRAASVLRAAMQKYAAGDKAGAEALFKQVLSIDPNNGDAHFNLAAIAEGRGDVQSALSHYRSARNANPNDGDIQQAIAQLEQQQSEKKNRELVAQRAQADAARDQQRKQRLTALAQDAAAAYRSQDYDRAIAGLEKVATEAPNDAEVQYGLAQAWRGKGDLNRARHHLQRAAGIDPGNQLYGNTLAEIQKDATREVASSPQETASPPGQITPFQGVDSPSENPYYGGGGLAGGGGLGGGGYDSYSGGGMLGSLSGLVSSLRGGGVGYMPMPSVSYSSGGYSSGGMGSGSRLSRAVSGGLAGAIGGALANRGSSASMKQGAMQGAIFGGLSGLLFGGY